MPKREDIKRIIVLGSGPIVIGQACEFDYSGTQAIKALRADGYEVVLVNSNPATIMTDPELADRTYIMPLLPQYLDRILEREKPDAILPTVGGQTALNLAIEADRQGILARHGVELLGAPIDVIERAEDREQFKAAMLEIGLSVPRSTYVRSVDEAWDALQDMGFPVIIRPSFTMGGSGAAIAYNRDEFEKHITFALGESLDGELLLEQSVLGWKEYELEVMRDAKDNFVVICSIENLDPMGVHTGDSITIAPSQTLTDKEYQRMRDHAKMVVSKVGVTTGGCNIQFAVNPVNGDEIVIEMNPRVSRSSALASKATGFPHRQVRRQDRRRLHARRAAQRHHQGHPGLVRAEHRLRGHQGPALRLREVPRCRRHADHPDEIGRRGDGHRPHVPRVSGQGDPQPRARHLGIRLGARVGPDRGEPARP